jgi:hypothetical protein
MNSKPTVYPKIGLDNARRHLDEVLSPSYRQFTERGTRANLLKVAEAAWAIHERLWHDKGCVPPREQFRQDLFKACPELRLMRDIAETGKHTGLNRGDVELDRITGAENPGGTVDIYGSWIGTGQPARHTSQPTCTLARDKICSTRRASSSR